MDDDIRHLDLLAIFHYVVALILALCGLFPIIHLVIGIAIVTGAFENGGGDPPPDFIGIILIAVALVVILGMWAMAIAVCLAGGRLRRREAYNYCLMVAAIECIFMPFGTVLGVLTIVVLMRPSVKAMFGITAPPVASS